jgi:hypothetical protein
LRRFGNDGVTVTGGCGCVVIPESGSRFPAGAAAGRAL